MPPKKRTRQDLATKNNKDAPQTSKRTKTDEIEASLPPKPVKKVNNVQSLNPHQIETKVHNAIKRIVNTQIKDIKIDDIELILRISPTEGDLLLGKDGQSNINNLTKISNAGITVSDKVELSVDREVIITGDLKSVATGTLATVFFMNRFVEKDSSVDSVYHFTLILSHKDIERVGIPNLRSLLPNTDFSSQFIPFSNRHTVYFKGKLHQIIEDLIVFLRETQNANQESSPIIADIPQTYKVPVVGINHSVLSPEAKSLLDKSKTSLLNYLKQETQTSSTPSQSTSTTTNTANIQQTSRQQIEQAIQECNKQVKSLDQLKFTIDFPADYVPLLNLTEIRSISNSNVVVLQNSTNKTDKSSSQLIVTGLAESNLIALRYLLKAL